MTVDKFEQWCLVEIFGHVRIAGFVTEQTVGGQSFVRVDVPKTSQQEGFTRLFGQGAIYSISPMAEDVVRGLAEKMQATPINAWDLPTDIREAVNDRKLLTAAPVNGGCELFEDDLENEDD